MIDPHNAEWEPWLQKWFIRLLVPAILVNAGGLLIPILEPDGALYATIAKTIARTGDFINLRVEGKDWLDKPHFPFWISAISFRCFGVNAFAYKFPALLFWALGAWYTWRMALSLYGKPIAQLSVLIYVSAAHLVISNNDVRAEPYLTGLIIGAVYHFYKASKVRPGLHLVFGSLLAGCAVMTKGPFVLITIAAGFLLDWIAGKDWDQFRNIRWWLAILLTFLFSLPELICLYLQFDLHPDKVVFGHTGVSGIRFFFWDSQFGRFFNTGPIKGAGDPFFYFHTLLWAFLPWSLILYAAVIQKCRRSADSGGTGFFRRSVYGDYICLGAAGGSFIIFSLSRFQLPHYLNILFPFFAILSGQYLYGIRRRVTQRALNIIQGIISVLLPILLLGICFLYHFDWWILIAVTILVLGIAPFLLFRGRRLTTALARSFWMALLVFSFVNFILYPAILRYQSGTQAGEAVSHMPRPAAVYMLQQAPANYSFEFYCPVPVERVPIDSLPHPAVVFVPSAFTDTLRHRGWRSAPLQTFSNFHVSQLTGEFLNWQTRGRVVESYSLLAVDK